MRLSRYLAGAKSARAERGFVFGVYEDGTLTSSASANAQFGTLLAGAAQRPGFKAKVGSCELVWSDDGVPAALVGLGSNNEGVGEENKGNNDDDRAADDVRRACATGYKQLVKKVNTIAVDSMGDARSAAEGATLAGYSYDRLKAADARAPVARVEPLDESDEAEFTRGRVMADAQNFARTLADTPANLMTPRLFCAELDAVLPDSVERTFHDKDWAVQERMGAFLSVSRGSDEPLRFAELRYIGDSAAPDAPVSICLVGKGVTFDSGGVSIKPSAGMSSMKGDMGGAASVAGAMLGIANLRLPINVNAVIPLCENMVNGSATKPGDVVVARNGTSIEVDNTDAEGRMLLADALDYAQEKYEPEVLVDLATLTGAMVVALGDAAIGTFANDDQLWQQLEEAGKQTGETLWRMPLMKRYGELMKSDVADVINAGTSRQAGSCTAAAFLQKFVKKGTSWSHMDIAGVMDTKGHIPYLPKGMTGMPTRTLIQLAANKLKQ